MRTGLDRCQESISWITARSESTARFYRNRYDKTKPGAISTGSPIPGAHNLYSSRFCICLPLIVFRSCLTGCGDCASNPDSLFGYELRTDRCRNSDDDGYESCCARKYFLREFRAVHVRPSVHLWRRGSLQTCRTYYSGCRKFHRGHDLCPGPGPKLLLAEPPPTI